jgi:dTDP-4-dehydrorhamnose 3,5-epimerase-like enzyme
MNINNDLNSVSGCCLLKAHKVVDDRGILCYADILDVIPFDIKRIFWIYGVGVDKMRGGHSHSTCSEAIFPVSGSFDIEVTDGQKKSCITMDEPSCGILIPAGIWCELKNFSPDAVCVVAASHHYDANGYINDFNEYKNQCK